MPILLEPPDFYAHNSSSWQTHKERLEIFFDINDTSPDLRGGILLISLRQDNYRKLADACDDSLKSKSYDELVELLNRLFVEHTSVFRQRRTFYALNKDPTQSVTRWLDIVKRRASECKFGNHIESIILEKFICGLKLCPTILNEFFKLEEETVSQLTLQNALEIAIHMENSMRRAKVHK